MAVLDWVKSHLLIILTMLGVAMGLILGFSLRYANLSADAIDLLSFPGELLMRALKMLILPLIASSLIVGVPSLDLKTSGHMGLRTVIYFLTTSVIAVLTGLILVLIMHPGTSSYKDELKSGDTRIPLRTADAFLDTFRNLFPDNVAQAMFQYTSTYYSMKNVTKRKYQYAPIPDGYNQNMSMADLVNLTNVAGAESGRIIGNRTRLVVVYHEMVKKRGLKMGMGMNVLGIITFAVSFSITLTTMGSKAVLMIEFFEVLNELVMKLMIMIMWYSPIGIMFLIAGNIAAMSNVSEAAQRVGWLSACVVTGVILHLGLVLPGLYFAVTRTNPLLVMQSVVHAMLTALGTASSAATLPVIFQCTEDQMRLDRRVTRFLLPIGVTVNMNGSALYFIICPIFIAQMNDISLTFGNLLSLTVTALFAAVGTAGVPGGGIITLLMVLASANLPSDDIGLLIGIDWFIDRFVTVANVTSDCYGCAIIAKLSERELSEVDKQPDLSDLLAELKRRNKEQREKQEERERARHEKEHGGDDGGHEGGGGGHGGGGGGHEGGGGGHGGGGGGHEAEKQPDVKALEGPEVPSTQPDTVVEVAGGHEAEKQPDVKALEDPEVPSIQPETVVEMAQPAAPSVDASQPPPAAVAPTDVTISIDDSSIPYADDPSTAAPPSGFQQPLPGMQQPDIHIQPAAIPEQPAPVQEQPGMMQQSPGGVQQPAQTLMQQPGMPQQLPSPGVPQQLPSPGMPSPMPSPGVPPIMPLPEVSQTMPSPGMPQQIPLPGMPSPMPSPGVPPIMPLPEVSQTMPSPGMPQQIPPPGMPSPMPSPGVPPIMPLPKVSQTMPSPGMPQQIPPPGMPSPMPSPGVPPIMPLPEVSQTMPSPGMPQQIPPPGMPQQLPSPGMPQQLPSPGMLQPMPSPGMPPRMPSPGVPQQLPPPGMPPRIPSPGMPQQLPSPGMPPRIPSPGVPQQLPPPGMPPRIPSPGMPQQLPSPGMPQQLPSPGMPPRIPSPGVPQQLPPPGMPQPMPSPGVPQQQPPPGVPQPAMPPQSPPPEQQPPPSDIDTETML